MSYPKGEQPSRWTAVLSPITTVHSSEVGKVLLITLNFFILFTAYYMIKPIREGLILSMDSGAEIKSYAGGIQALAFMFLVPIYGVLASLFSGRGILIFVYIFVASTLLIFMALGMAGLPYIGVVFFLWVGMFNLLVISQTWSLCNDMYKEEQGKRLFPLIALGTNLGAVFGSQILSTQIHTLGLFWPMAIAAGLLFVCAVIVRLTVPDDFPAAKRLPLSQESPWKRLLGGFSLIAANRYLMLVALLILIINFVNTTSEYMLGKLVADHFKSQAALGLIAEADVGILIGAFFSRFFFWMNIIVVVLQLFLVSRIIRVLGPQTALFALPILALLSYSLILIIPILSIVMMVKLVENSTDYSLNNTAREMLFLPLTRVEKYKAKFATDTFFWRGGDALSSVAVAIMSSILGLGISAFAGLNAVVVLVWIVLVRRISIRQKAVLSESLKP